MYNRLSISDYYRDALEKVRSAVLRESEGQIIGSSTDELAQYYYQEYALIPIEYDDSRETMWEHQNYVARIPAHQRDNFYQSKGDLDLQCEKVQVEIPIKSNKDIQMLSGLQSSTFSISFSEEEFHWGSSAISFSIETKGYGFSYEEDRIVNEVNNGIKRVKDLIQWKNNDICVENIKLIAQIKTLIETRKSEIAKSKEKMESLTRKINIPLKKQVLEGAKRIVLDHQPIVKRIKPTTKLPEEYVLDEAKVKDILEVLDNQVRSFEKTPSAVKTLGEEDLRDLLLANLNSLFEGKATGETFSKKGKTDIYLNIDKGSILVFECKIWGGKKLLWDTVDQLRGYLTWRHNFGIIIIFARIKSFTKTLSEIPGNIQESLSYRNGCRKISDNHFSAVHILDDPDKEVEIHYLIYNLFCE